MTTLTDGQIKRLYADGTIGISPWEPAYLNPCSLDVRLGCDFAVYTTNTEVDVCADEPKMTRIWAAPGNAVKIEAGMFALAETVETVRLPAHILARFEGKSTLGRYGLMTHVTAGFIDPGFQGTITLELHNVGPAPLILHTGQRIGQLAFEMLSTPVTLPYYETGRYNRQSGPTPPKPLGLPKRG